MISSDGPAGKVQDQSMGVYNKKETLHNNKPFYVNNRNDRVLFYHKSGDWRVGDELGAGGRIATIKKGLANLPIGAGGWQFWNGTNDIPDPKLTVGQLTRGMLWF